MFKQVIKIGIYIPGLFGCATFKTLDTHFPLYERIFIYSGTQLDWAAITKNDAAISKLKATPPCYPLVDLPFVSLWIQYCYRYRSLLRFFIKAVFFFDWQHW